MHDIGVRVVRGPDWKWGNQDNSEGHVGTVVEIGRSGSSSSPDKTVVVQWDMGSRTNYRIGYQEAYDLRVFDNAPQGVRHPNVICDGCKDHGVSGMLWKCGRCFDFDLCTTCYMNDTHDLSHPFRRFDTPTSVPVDVEPRINSPKIVSKGIFAGARVVRGCDWDWGNQDGGEGKIGRVIDTRGWEKESGRSVANVIWSSGSTNVYRLGHKGKVDLKCVQASSAGSYYVNHLPILGMPATTVSRNSTAGTPKAAALRSQSHSFNVGDKVQVTADINRLKEMQEGHGGWNPRMAEFVGKVGTLHRVTDKGDIRVEYESGIRWTFNASALTKITSFSVGDTVQVTSDMVKLKELQRGHGEWVDVMKEYLGRTGTILKIYPDNDLRINFGKVLFTMNPLGVRLVPSDRFESNNSMYANANRREETMSHDPMTAMLPQLLGELSLDTSAYTVERFVRECAQGRLETVKKMLPKMRERINHKSSGKTPLQVASHQGHFDLVVLLIANGANLEISDDDGDNALHFAAFGNQPLVMELLLKAGALVNAINRGQCSALHVAVNKQFGDCVKTLLKYKCNVNIQDNFADTPLHDAIGKDNHEIIDCLINTPGVDFTLRNNRGFNVLHHAALKGNHYAVERLLSKARQLVDVKKDDGFSALHLACLNGHYGVTKALVEEGQADIEIRNNRKQTPLHLATSQGYCGIVEYLISQGAVVSPEDEDSDTPLHVILTKHFDTQTEEIPSSSSATPAGQALNPVTAVELRKHENAPQIAAIWNHLLTCGWDVGDDDLGPAALCCFLVSHGAESNIRTNRRGLSPLDLVQSDRLRAMLTYYSAEPMLRTPTIRSDESPSGEGPSQTHTNCMTSPVSVASGISSSCSPAAPLPLPICPPPPSISPPWHGECLMCSEIVDYVVFDPCGHRIACEECCIRMKKCITCKESIERKTNRSGKVIGNSSGPCSSSGGISSVASGSSSNSSATSSLGGVNKANPNAERLKYLEKKFAEIEDTYCCSICMERKKNVIFLCGHGACEKCAKSLTTCHMCRKPITQKVNVY